jgi:translation initiation factor 5A
MSEKIFAKARDIKVGKYLIVDGEACRVVSVDVSKPGKHGAAKMRITAIGIFDNQKRVMLTPSDADVEVPIIERKTVQIISVSGNSAQVMDPDTYEIYDIEIPEEFADKAKEGAEADIVQALNKRKVERIRG